MPSSDVRIIGPTSGSMLNKEKERKKLRNIETKDEIKKMKIIILIRKDTQIQQKLKIEEERWSGEGWGK